MGYPWIDWIAIGMELQRIHTLIVCELSRVIHELSLDYTLIIHGHIYKNGLSTLLAQVTMIDFGPVSMEAWING